MEYKRFVSYLYVYQNQVKQKNCGFVKVEIRQNLVRFILNMYLPEKRGSEYHIYGFVRNEGKLDGILLGRVRGKNGSVDIRIQKAADNLDAENQGMHTPGVSIEQLSGILVTTEEGDLYGTVWDDMEIDVSTFRPQREKKSAALKEPEKRTEAKQENDEAYARQETEYTVQETEIRSSTEEQTQIRQENEMVRSGQDNIQSEQGNEAMMSGQDSVQSEQGSEYAQSAQKTAKAAFGQPEDIRSAQPKNTAYTSRQLHAQDYSQNMDWDAVMQKCPAIQPFAHDDSRTYYRLEPKDLKYLPRTMWHLGRNSFLLHGYYNYRYLILGKEEQGMVLGVPGIYYPMEESVAAMFGFRSFRAAEGRAGDRGTFGYWCRHFTDH